MNIRYEKVNDSYYYCYVNNHLIGDIVMSEDGFYNFWKTPVRSGYWPSWLLRELADKLDELNLEWELQIQKEIGNG